MSTFRAPIVVSGAVVVFARALTIYGHRFDARVIDIAFPEGRFVDAIQLPPSDELEPQDDQDRADARRKGIVLLIVAPVVAAIGGALYVVLRSVLEQGAVVSQKVARIPAAARIVALVCAYQGAFILVTKVNIRLVGVETREEARLRPWFMGGLFLVGSAAIGITLWRVLA